MYPMKKEFKKKWTIPVVDPGIKHFTVPVENVPLLRILFMGFWKPSQRPSLPFQVLPCLWGPCSLEQFKLMPSALLPRSPPHIEGAPALLEVWVCVKWGGICWFFLQSELRTSWISGFNLSFEKGFKMSFCLCPLFAFCLPVCQLQTKRKHI